MRNYIKAELYRNIRRPYFINFTIIVSMLAVLGQLLLANGVDSPAGAFEMGRELLNLPIYLIIIFMEIFTFEDIKNGTIKNTISSGLSRGKIIIGKEIGSVILAFISALIILGFYFSTSFFIYPAMGRENMYLVYDFIYSILGALPVWIAFICMGNLIGILIKSDVGISLAYLLSIKTLPNILILVLKIMKLDRLAVFVNKISLSHQLDILTKSAQPSRDFIYTGFLGLAYIIILTMVSIYFFKKRDF